MSGLWVGSLEALPVEVLERVAFYLATSNRSTGGPPSDLLSLLPVSKTIHSKISIANNKALYGALYRFKFDDQALQRRLSWRWSTDTCLSAELVKRFTTLSRIRREIVETDDLWTCVLMIMENDGKNILQLRAAHLHKYIEKVLLIRLSSRGDSVPPWFHDLTLDSLIVWILWASNDRGTLKSQPASFRKLVSDILHPFIVMGFKFPSLYGGDLYGLLPLHAATEALTYGSQSPPTTTISHYFHRLTIASPLVVPAATLLYTAYVEELQSSLALTLPPESIPTLQQEALNDFHYHTRLATVQQGSSIAVLYDFDLHRRDGREAAEKGTAPGNPSLSSQFDEDWYRMTSCYDVHIGESPLRGIVYRPGTLTGSWKGRFLQPDWIPYTGALRGRASPTSVPLLHKPLYWDLEEYHCLHPDLPLSIGEDAAMGYDDILNAWIPRGTEIRHLQDAMEVYDPETKRTVRYHKRLPRGVAPPYSKDAFEKLRTRWISADLNKEIAGSPGRNGKGTSGYPDSYSDMSYMDDDERYADTVSHRCSGVADILICGQTTDRYRDAWGDFKFIGRVRPWDGLVVLLCEASAPYQTNIGTWIFKGYVHDQNFVGRWRETSTPVDMVGLEGSFVLTKTDDSDIQD